MWSAPKRWPGASLLSDKATAWLAIVALLVPIALIALAMVAERPPFDAPRGEPLGEPNRTNASPASGGAPSQHRSPEGGGAGAITDVEGLPLDEEDEAVPSAPLVAGLAATSVVLALVAVRGRRGGPKT